MCVTQKLCGRLCVCGVLTWWVLHKRNRPVALLAMIMLVEFSSPCAGTSSWPNLCSPTRCMFGKRWEQFQAYHRSAHPDDAVDIRCIRDRSLVLRVLPPVQRMSIVRPNNVYNLSNYCGVEIGVRHRNPVGTYSIKLLALVGTRCV